MTADGATRGVSWLALVPRDTMMIRDGRSFDAAQDASAQTVRPWPSTMAGAIGAAFGAEPGTTPLTSPCTVPDEVRGPVLARCLGGVWEPYFPVPADLVQEADAQEAATAEEPYVFRLSLSSDAAQTDLDGAGMRWLTTPVTAGKVKPLLGWIPGSALSRYLAGDPPPGADIRKSSLGCEDPFQAELRVGLARGHDRQARAGFLYRATQWRLEEDWGFLAGCVLGDDWDRPAEGPVQFGGLGRLADVQPVAEMAWPSRPAAFPGGRVLAYLATPALWPGGWRIRVPDGADLVAAATGEPEAVATSTPGGKWQASRALRWAVPAGSVYLLEFADEARAAQWASDCHGTAYGLKHDDPLRTAGFGIVLTGVWT